MKFKKLLIMCLGLSFLGTSCIKEEGVDREADIVSISIENKGFLTSIINEQTRQISLIMEGDISAYQYGTIVPKIQVSPGAIVSPSSLEPASLNNYRAFYTVTAEDRMQKSYTVSVAPYIPLIQDFEDWKIIYKTNQYESPVDPMWDNANEGVDMLYRANTPFPTRSTTEDIRPGSEGQKAVILETVEGNNSPLIDLMNIPVYAGNMFRGSFDISVAMKDPLLTTKFGQPHPSYLGKPLALTTWYKYKSGDTYVTYEKVNGKKVIEKIENRKRLDTPDLYAVLYKVDKGEAGREVFLNGYTINPSDPSTRDKKIVASASLQDTSEKDEWTLLEAKFTYYEEVDFDEYDYKLAIVLSSSHEGALYKGAIGSMLLIDDLRIICEIDEDADLYPLD